MKDYIKEFFGKIEKENPELYRSMSPILVYDRLGPYLDYKLTGNESPLEIEIKKSLETAKEDESSAGFLYYDAAILNLAKGDLGRAEAFAKKARDCFSWIISSSRKNEEYELLRDAYKLRMGECDYLIANLNTAYNALESAYSEFQKKEDIKEVISELRIEQKIWPSILMAKAKHEINDIKKDSIN